MTCKHTIVSMQENNDAPPPYDPAWTKAFNVVNIVQNSKSMRYVQAKTKANKCIKKICYYFQTLLWLIQGFGLPAYEIYLFINYHNEPCEVNLSFLSCIRGIVVSVLSTLTLVVFLISDVTSAVYFLNGHFFVLFIFWVADMLMTFPISYSNHICPQELFLFHYIYSFVIACGMVLFIIINIVELIC